MKRIVALLVSLMLLVGCTAIAEEPEVALPLTEEPVTFTYWFNLDPWKAAPEIDNYNEVAAYQELEKLTGVHIDFIHPVIGQETEQFNLMVASGEYPDIIWYNWTTYPGGIEKAVSDGLIIPLNDLIDQYCPNVKAKVVGNPEIARTLATDSGDYDYFPYIHWNQLIKAGWTYQVRQDRLQELNLELPETMDEYEATLLALKAAYPDKYPLCPIIIDDSRNILRHMANAYGTDLSFYIGNNGEIKYGPLDPEFKDYLITMNRWYNEGLIDPEFTSMDITAMEAKILNGDASMWLSGMDFGRYLIAMGEHAVTCTKFPVLNKGDLPIYNNGTIQGSQGQGAAISTSCKNPELAAKWLDLHYSEMGHNLLNFGIEGESYDMVNGTPTFRDVIVNNPEGKSVELALVKYAMSGICESFFHDPLVRFARMGTFEEQRLSIERTQTFDLSHKLPNITPTEAESLELANIMSEVDTYLDECWVKFIKGQLNFDEDYDKFVENIHKMSISDAIAIEQAAYDRFMAR